MYVQKCYLSKIHAFWSRGARFMNEPKYVTKLIHYKHSCVLSVDHVCCSVGDKARLNLAVYTQIAVLEQQVKLVQNGVIGAALPPLY